MVRVVQVVQVAVEDLGARRVVEDLGAAQAQEGLGDPVEVQDQEDRGGQGDQAALVAEAEEVLVVQIYIKFNKFLH